MVRYCCRDMGLKCTFVAKGETVEEVTQKALEHVKMYHAEEFNLLDSPAHIKDMENALARSTRIVAG